MKLDLRKKGSIPESYRAIYENVARDVRRSLTHTIESISKLHPGELDWFLSSPASRNTFASPLFTHCCRIIFLKNLIDQGVVIDTIVTDSPALAKLLRRWMEKKKYQCIVAIDATIRSRLKLATAILYRLIGYPAVHIWQFFHAISTRNTRAVSTTSSPLTLVDTFVISDCEENDRNYPGMLDYLTDSEKEAVYYVPTFYRIGPQKVRRVFKRLRASGRNILFKEDYLKLSDYLFAFGHIFRILKIQLGPAMFKGEDISGLIQEEIRSFRRLGDTMIALLNFRFAFRLKRAGVSLRLVIDWFENQVGDKGWNAGFNTNYQETHTIGYMGFINTEYYLCDRPTLSEKLSGLLPKTICVMGRGIQESIKEFCTELDVETAPAFRFSHLHSKMKCQTEGKRSEFKILVALPFSAQDTERIMAIVESIAHGLPENIIFGIKTHPITSILPISNINFGNKLIKRLYGDFSTLLQKTDLLISTASSVCMETIAKGIPVIVVGNPNGLTLNPIPDSVSSDLWRLVYNAEEMLTAILSFKERDDHTMQRHKNEGKFIRENFFSPVTEENVRRFLRLLRQ